MGILAQVLQGRTPDTYHTRHIPSVHLEASDFTSLVSTSSHVKYDNDRIRKVVVRTN